jgi:hypothetical protein
MHAMIKAPNPEKIKTLARNNSAYIMGGPSIVKDNHAHKRVDQQWAERANPYYVDQIKKFWNRKHTEQQANRAVRIDRINKKERKLGEHWTRELSEDEVRLVRLKRSRS